VALRFGDCRLDVDARRLFRGSREVHLSPKEFELLKVLIEAHPRALSKEQLLEQVWPGVFVSDASLARVVNQIRNAVGDSARRPRIIRTVHRYGYAFVADVSGDSPRRQLPGSTSRRRVCYLVLGHRTFPLNDGEHIVGREPDVTVWLDSPKVSRQHAKIVVKGERVTIEDLGSKNGTFVRGTRIRTPVALQPADTIDVGPFTMDFQRLSASRTTETAASRTKPSR
jgi:DNA-binding winged helix-turn-helix (wHTH) protein